MFTLKVYNEEANIIHMHEGDVVSVHEEKDGYLVRLDSDPLEVWVTGMPYTKAWIMNSSGATVHTLKV